jgi:hypothetical protein
MEADAAMNTVQNLARLAPADNASRRPDARTRSGRACAARPCEACGELIQNPRRGQRFCYWPRKCRKSQWAEEHRRPYVGARPARPCEHCGELIENPRRNQRFCRAPRDCRVVAGYKRTYSSDAAAAKYAATAGARIIEDVRHVDELAVLLPALRSARSSETAMISILLESMPAPGSSWPREARAQWMLVFERTLDAIYPGGR